MSNPGQVSAVLTAQQMLDAKAGIVALRTLLPFLISISQQARQELPKMGERSVGFMEKTVAYMGTNPEFLPGFVDMAEVLKDRELWGQLSELLGDLTQLFDGVGDTTIVAGHELWMACLAYYQSVRQAAKRNIPGAEVIYNDLKTRFPGNPGTVTPPTNP